MQYLADTVTIVRYFSDTGRMGVAARSAMDGADRKQNIIFISVFTLAEILYLAEKGRISIDLLQVAEIIASTSNYQIVDLNLEIIVEAQNVKGLELHDRLIVATARTLGIPIITSDTAITKSGLLEVIW
jgi:PIN domain nuclease of toxin-antitoxin system